jgi:hypothetical protein
MMCSSRTCQTIVLAVSCALLITATVGDSAHAEGHLDASYTIHSRAFPLAKSRPLRCSVNTNTQFLHALVQVAS